MQKMDKNSLEGVSGGFVASNAARFDYEVINDIERQNYNRKIREIADKITQEMGLSSSGRSLIVSELANKFATKAKVTSINIHLAKNHRGYAEGTIEVDGPPAPPDEK